VSEIGVLINEVKHIAKSLAGLHRKADKTNGNVGKLDKRVVVLESKDVMTKAACNAHRLASARRTLYLIIGAIVTFLGGYLLHLLTGGKT
jgi:hypothetical protein